MTEARQVTRQFIEPAITYVGVASFIVVASVVLFR